MKNRVKKTADGRMCLPLLSYSGAAGLLPVCRLLSVLLCVMLAFLLQETGVLAAEGYDKVAGKSSMGDTNEELAPYGMTPVSGNMIEDGEYVVGTECSSSFFRIEEARLTVKDGKMTALLRMYSSSYLLVYPGTAEEAAAADYEDYIPSVEIDDYDTFTVPVEALDTELELAAFSKRKKAWDPRKILFHASDIPSGRLRFSYPDYDRISEALASFDAENDAEDRVRDSQTGSQAAAGTDSQTDSRTGSQAATGTGSKTAPKTNSRTASDTDAKTGEPQAVQIDMPDGDYSIEVNLMGGSGRASVTTPTWMYVQGGKGYARLLWSSPHYDYMILDGRTYYNETKDGGNSSFTIPITAMDLPVDIIADTTAMGDPVEIAYTLTFYEETIGSRSRVPQEGALRVLAAAALFIVAGGIINHFVKKRRQ